MAARREVARGTSARVGIIHGVILFVAAVQSMQKVFINVALVATAAARFSLSLPSSLSLPLSIYLSSLFLLLRSHVQLIQPSPSLAPLLATSGFATCSRQRLINGLQAQARIPGSFLMDSGNSTGNNAARRDTSLSRRERERERERERDERMDETVRARRGFREARW